MRCAIDFDDEPRRQGDEVDDIRAEPELPPEAEMPDLLAAQLPPQQAFSFRRVLSQIPDETISHRRCR
ncbi:hypothetical protein P409_08135 [Inquilinus limosus MP06]|uniref:Uncharacterized protein n=1 Tax=Inquilinus limosus MP06 TaxID=1398085 RepID=A0A0A0D800_9PROT|nr:hypothetical protein P409_08135 [Inquilinus limosus MP06]